MDTNLCHLALSRVCRRLAVLLMGVVLLHAPAYGETPPEQFAPLPADAQPLPDNRAGYRLEEIAPDTYVVIAGFYQSVFVVTRRGVVLIDAPPSLVEALKDAIASVTALPVTHLILSHSHHDHIGAAGEFPHAKLIAQEETARLLALWPDPDRPQPDETFREATRLHIGGEEFRLSYPGVNHEAGNIIVYLPRQRVAIMADVAIPGWVPFRGWGNGDSLPGLLKAYDALLALEFDTYVAGHVYRVGTRADLENAREFAYDLWALTAAALVEVPFPDLGTRADAANVWASQYIWLERIAEQVAAALSEKWQGRLAGLDTFTRDTVVAVVVSYFTDNPAFLRPPD